MWVSQTARTLLMLALPLVRPRPAKANWSPPPTPRVTKHTEMTAPGKRTSVSAPHATEIVQVCSKSGVLVSLHNQIFGKSSARRSRCRVTRFEFRLCSRLRTNTRNASTKLGLAPQQAVQCHPTKPPNQPSQKRPKVEQPLPEFADKTNHIHIQIHILSQVTTPAPRGALVFFIIWPHLLWCFASFGYVGPKWGCTPRTCK